MDPELYQYCSKLIVELNEMRSVAMAALEYIDAIPKDLEFGKAMPGFDRDWADSIISKD